MEQLPCSRQEPGSGDADWMCAWRTKVKSTLLREVCFEDGLGAVDVDICAYVLADVCGSVHASYAQGPVLIPSMWGSQVKTGG